MYLASLCFIIIPLLSRAVAGGATEKEAATVHHQGGANVLVSPTRALASGTCGNGNRGNGICPNTSLCCSQYGYCGTGTAYCGPAKTPTKKPVKSPTSRLCPAGWSQASWTTYTSYAPCCPDSPNYDPNADTTECDEYSACDYTGDFAYIGHKSFNYVKSNNLVAFFSVKNNASYGGKRIRISAKGKTIEALVADTCGDSDCNGCCSTNAKPSGNLVDMEYWTVVRNFGSISAASGQICWQLV